MSIEFARLFRSAPHGYLVLSPQLIVEEVNETYLATCAVTREDLVGRPASDVISWLLGDPSEVAAAELHATLQRAVEDRAPVLLPSRRYRVRSDGDNDDTQRALQFVHTPMLGDDGELLGILQSVEELKDQDSAAAAQSERSFALLLDAAPDPIIVVDAKGRLEVINEQTVAMFGYERSELLGAPLELLLPERLRGRHAELVHRFFTNPKPRAMGAGLELVARRKNGTEFPIEVSLSPLSGEAGTTVMAALRDISQRKQAEAQAKLNAERFASAMETMQDAFAVFDADDRLVRCNAAYRHLLEPALPAPSAGMKRAQLVDAWLSLMEADTPETSLLREQWLRGRPGHVQTFDIRTRQQRSLRVSDRPTGQGDFVEVVWDVTEDEQRAAELRLARAEAEAASAAKSEFLSSMSHELRTPMNAILGFAQLLARDAKDPLPARHRERVSHILRGGEHLLRLINDVLDLARIESGRVSISAEPVSLNEVLAELLHTLEPLARERRVTLACEPIEASFPRVHADRVRLLQILLNFGSNAIKYNRPGGRVWFRAELRDDRVSVLVEDTGLGIPLAQQSKLFQAFHRAGQEAGPIEGTGIGLLITKKLVELMGGQVGFTSQPGAGSVFWVELPLSAAGRRGAPTLSASPTQLGVSRGLVLYVEDNPANVDFMRDLFDELDGVRLVTARTAEEGILLAQSLLPQVILMDINLPDMNGRDALLALRRSTESSTIPVIALTAAASERDRTRGIEAGFFRYLTKPLDIDELIRALHAALHQALGTTTTDAFERP